MSDYKHCCVTDQNGNYITFVLVLLEPNEIGEVQKNIQYYTLKDGEKLLDAPPPSNLLKPQWDFANLVWEETATAEEIAKWEQSKPTFPQPSPTPPISLEQQVADLKTALTLQRQVTDSLLISALEV